MQLIVGLGNPGEKYINTRHNTGFLVIEELKNRISNQLTNSKFSKKLDSEIIKTDELVLAMPTIFMNDSGIAVRKLSTFYHIPSTSIYVIHDDLDIKLGQYKIQQGVGPKVHNGVNSIEEKLRTKDFWRVRVGVDNRISNSQLAISNSEKTREVEYVLQKFTNEEMEKLNGVIKDIVGDLMTRLELNN